LTRQNSAELNAVLLESSVESIASTIALTSLARSSAPCFLPASRGAEYLVAISSLSAAVANAAFGCLPPVLSGYGESPATANPICC